MKGHLRLVQLKVHLLLSSPSTIILNNCLFFFAEIYQLQDLKATQPQFVKTNSSHYIWKVMLHSVNNKIMRLMQCKTNSRNEIHAQPWHALNDSQILVFFPPFPLFSIASPPTKSAILSYYLSCSHRAL